MAIYHTRSSKKTAPLTPRFVALVALIAVVGLQASPSSSTSIFALAADGTRGSSNSMLLQRTTREEDVGEEIEHEFVEEEEELQYEGSTRGFTNRMLLQRTQAEQEDADDGVEVIVAKAAAICEDKQTIKIKPRKGRRMLVCDYVKQKPEARCRKTIKKVVKRKGTIVRTIRIKPEKHCCETCSADEPTPSPIEQTQTACPEDEPWNEQTQEGDLCFSDREDLGFVKGQVCHYGGWVGTGCTEEEYQCQPVKTCTCGDDGTWVCPLLSYKGVNLATDCERDPPPYELSGEPCDPTDSEPTSPIDQTQSTCPLHVPFDITENGPEGHLCLSDREELGFVNGQICNYDYVGTGCTEEQYQCQPKYICSCGILDGATWTCTHQHLTGVGQFHVCDRDPPPYKKSGEPCDPAASNLVGIRQ